MGNSQCQSFRCTSDFNNCKCKSCEANQEVEFEEAILINEEEARNSFRREIRTPLARESNQYNNINFLDINFPQVTAKIPTPDLNLINIDPQYSLPQVEMDSVPDDENDFFDKNINPDSTGLNKPMKNFRISNPNNFPLQVIKNSNQELSRDSHKREREDLRTDMLKFFDEESKRMLTSNQISGFIRKKES